MADNEGEPAPQEGLDARVSSLETGQHSLSDKLDKILGIVGDGGGDTHDQEPSGAPNVAEEIRRQLDERRARDAENEEKQSLKDGLAEVRAALTEKSPEPMPRRVEKFMGWR